MPIAIVFFGRRQHDPTLRDLTAGVLASDGRALLS
jgi:hypothetical protein